MVSEKRFNGDGAQRIFPVEFKILGEEYVRLYVDGVLINDNTTYDIINNSVVVTEGNEPPVGTDNVQVFVATSVAELDDLATLQTNIDIVANDIGNVNIVAGDSLVIGDVASEPLRSSILNAESNATSASGSAVSASASASAANLSALAASTSETNAGVSEANASASEANALASASSASASETVAITQAGIATTQAGIATTKATEAQTSANSVNADLIIHADGSGLPNEIGTYLPSPTVSLQASSVLLDGNLAIDDSNLNITSGKFTFTDGLSDNGYDVALETVTGSIDFSTATDGINYVAKELGGGYQFYTKRPMNGLYTKESADDNRLVFDTESGKYWTTTGGELVTNGTFDSNYTGWSSRNGATLSQLNGTMGVLSPSGSAVYAAQLVSNLIVGQKYTATVSNSYGGTAGRNRGIQIRSSDESSVTASSYITSSGTVAVTFTANETSHYIYLVVDAIAANDYSYFDNISVFEAEPTLSTPLATPISFLPYPWMVASGTPQYEVIDIEPLADVVANNVEFNQVRAKEYKGKNACTAWVNFDGTTTPPTIRDSYNVSNVVRIATGIYDVYFEEDMDNTNYSIDGIASDATSQTNAITSLSSGSNDRAINKVRLTSVYVASASAGVGNRETNCIQVFGGKN